MKKLYIGGFVLTLVILVVWQYTSLASKNGQLEQANAELIQTIEDGEKEREKLKRAAALNTATIDKVSKEKSVLNTYALNKVHELEILKHENSEIKKWSVSIIPYIIAGKLYNITGDNNKDGLYITTDGVINTHTGSKIEVQNEDLYNYTTELKAALQSCNIDKKGLSDWYIMVPTL